MAKTELITLRRNTAIASIGLLQHPCSELLANNVQDGSYLFSFDPSDPESEPLFMLCEDEASREWTQHITEPFLVQHWAAKRVPLAERDGDSASIGVRLVLIDPQGETLAFVSKGALQSWDIIRQLRGDGPYNPPIRIIVKQIGTRAGFHVYKLFIAERQVKAKEQK